MGIFSDVLLTVDYDKTLTATDSTIPRRNLEAISFFMENGGAFTVNTGRSVPMSEAFLKKVPVNAPLLLYNGAAAYDTKTGTFPILHTIPMDQAEVLNRFMERFPEAVTEVQGLKAHYAFREDADWARIYEAVGCPYVFTVPEADMGPFLKIGLCCFADATKENLFRFTPEHAAEFDRYEAILNREFGDKLTIMRSAPQMLDIMAANVNKGIAARELARQMDRKILVCVGDERNDIAMLDMADYAFCPSDGKMAPYYANVCPCGQGAVADVIYKKIPEILGISLDKG